jgi:hypothetical protein
MRHNGQECVVINPDHMTRSDEQAWHNAQMRAKKLRSIRRQEELNWQLSRGYGPAWQTIDGLPPWQSEFRR